MEWWAWLALLVVIGWGAGLLREAKRSADALEQIAFQLDLDSRDKGRNPHHTE